MITIVMRGKGDCDAFLEKFGENWKARAWEKDSGNDRSGKGEDSGAGSGSASGSFYTREGAVRMVGVSGILRKEQEMWESTDKSLQDAFQDLNALMVMSLGVFVLLYLWQNDLCACHADFCDMSCSVG